MNYYDTLIEVADDSPATEARVPEARGGKKTKALIEYELLAGHAYTYTEEDIAFEVYAVVHDIPAALRPTERKKFLSKGHPHLRVSPLAKRYGWGIYNNAEGKIALVAVESPEYRQLLNDPRTTKIKAFRSGQWLGSRTPTEPHGGVIDCSQTHTRCRGSLVRWAQCKFQSFPTCAARYEEPRRGRTNFAMLC